ncbi:hypothetical protein TPHA_0K00700 [Tetrapisispora phaffii CBS 4417]|uniref:RING-type domain-containing protein n=1 Tax=Tetrapisispora phaffii (strain ATCC 24235 / CBS 4417 / NBRC 1672 / NRRL Y-8282 / UCD 70-5) TaxID=1071381 RepID=G8BZ76_TETPH|nr:hypothetical protein TPHA_0K00700 [Tetrapisispora phaffii CBS 4417]CCE65204.1 hypothetical protein TPHA_0K00700 [Tetrapisispora phaffii CBS 4417]
MALDTEQGSSIIDGNSINNNDLAMVKGDIANDLDTDNDGNPSDSSLLVISEKMCPNDSDEDTDLDLLQVLDEEDDTEESVVPKRRKIETIDLEDIEHLQKAIELSDDGYSDEGSDSEELKENRKANAEKVKEHKPVRDYKCPICMDPPTAAVITNCGHIFCNDCLFPMINSSKKNARSDGICALCRCNVKCKDLRLVILKKKIVPKSF